ncbi:MAG: peptidylprolyl isomerase, partial [Bacteroidetes bacterium]|nr:peptidylprolyl isomerase [Bacteroidota bacterium]
YVELFVNFKLKVREAESLGLDTTDSFKNELAGYRKQLAQPYLTDTLVDDNLLKEAYERMKIEINASHILINLSETALPKDTLIAYQKAIKLRERILKGENFGEIAKSNSDDPSAKDNEGNLGYFTALQMVYPFESAAYGTDVEGVSLPVRTRFGYHLIKVHHKRPARGQILVAHIMVENGKVDASSEDSVSVRAKIEEIYKKLKGGEDFAMLAQQYSDDKGSARRGGELPIFGTGRMVPEFENAAFELKKDGDISEIVQTRFGMHIIKRLEKKEMVSFDDMKGELKAKISKDSRSQLSRTALINKIKKENNFKESLKARDKMASVIDSTYFAGEWKAEKAKKLKKSLWSIGDQKFTQQDFAEFLEVNQAKRPAIPAEVLINSMYANFVETNVIAYEESRLEQKYPEFKALMQEYRDGILLFELTDRMVWSKAVSDTVGLEAFYEKNKNNFMWGERIDVTIYSSANEKIAQQAGSLVSQSKPTEEISKAINKDSQLNLKIESGKFSKGENEIADGIEWKPGITKNIKKDQRVVFVHVHEKLKAQPKSLKEARGLVTAEYQTTLEKQWIESLKAKYPVVINKEILQLIN